MMNTEERIYTKKENRDNQDNQDNQGNSYSYMYDFEIKLHIWKKILILLLNILTGGLGTLIEPFLNEKNRKKRLIFAAIILSFFQILHFLHAISLLNKVKFLEDIYDKICDDDVFKIIFGDEKEDDNGEEEQSEQMQYFNSFIEDNKLNVAELISKNSRITFLKECFAFISGMSYCNSIFSLLLDFMKDEKNKVLSYKVVFYSILNPGGGIVLASFALIPTCDCSKGIYHIQGIVICIISITLGLIVMLTPISLILGLFLTKITKRMITLFPLKITLIFIGCLGILISIITSGYNKKLIKDSFDIFKTKKENLLPFQITFKVGEKLDLLRADFGCESFSRLIANMIIPGSGTLSLICKYCNCNNACSFFLVGIIQFFIGGLFFISIILLVFQEPYVFSFFYNIIFSSDIKEMAILIRYVNYFYTIGLCYYFSGILLILVSDYLRGDKIENIKNELSGIAGVILNLFTGGLGTLLFLVIYGESFRPFQNNDENELKCECDLCCIFCFYCYVIKFICCNSHCRIIMVVLIILIGGFIGYFGTLYIIFFSDIASKASKITYPIFYFIFSIIFGLLPLMKDHIENRIACPIKKKINNKYQIIKINDVEIYN